MEYLTVLRNLRRVALTSFLITILFVIVFWAFVMTNAMEHFMWALPGFDLEATNIYVMWLAGALEVAGILLFLIPSIALSLEIRREKRRAAREEREWEEFREQLFGEIKTTSKPAKAKAKPKAKAKAKTKKKK
ncbi:MAG: hypothetical protein FWE17_01205 [Alphaproteobacteria bacterium]|nr:hypothetical protein [Alphaproteobacteria bacterium]MCL2758541.1 hypothetical protein [Alphaproteobacteria bacterium]